MLVVQRAILLDHQVFLASDFLVVFVFVVVMAEFGLDYLEEFWT
jgi:hypothetical protein